MILKYMDDIPPIEEDIDFEGMPKVRLPEIKFHEWVNEIKVQLDDGAILPTRGHEEDAGYDLYAPKNMITKYLWKNDSIVIDTGVHMAIPKGYCGVIISKSGLNTKCSVTTHGLVDSGYTGSIKIKMYNHGEQRLHIEPGDKISQIVIMPCVTPPLILTDKLPKTERGDGGFGSTGRK